MSPKSNCSSADSAEKTTIKTGAEIIVDTLIELGVDTMFGYLGGVVLPLFDKLYDAPINFIIPRHEQGPRRIQPPSTPSATPGPSSFAFS